MAWSNRSPSIGQSMVTAALIVSFGLGCGGSITDDPSKTGAGRRGGAANGTESITGGSFNTRGAGQPGGATEGSGGSGTASASAASGAGAELPADQRLRDLTSDEITQLNAGVDAYAKQQIATLSEQQLCHRQAVLHASIIAGAGASGTDEEVKNNCNAAERRCVAQELSPTIDTRDFHPNSTNNAPGFQTCNATVGKYQSCASDLTGAHLNVIHSLPPCDSLDTHSFPEGLETLPIALTVPSSCTALYAECSNLERRGQD